MMQRFCLTAIFFIPTLTCLPAQAQEGNRAIVTQTGSGNQVFIRQQSAADENNTSIEQDFTDEHGNRTLVLQQGSANMANVSQHGINAQNNMKIERSTWNSGIAVPTPSRP